MLRMRAARLEAMVATHRQVEKALARERNQLRTLIDTLPDYVFFKDSDGRFINANLATAHWVGVESPQQLIARTDFDYHGPKLAGQFYSDEQAVIKSGVPLRNKEVLVSDTDEGKVWHSHTKVPLKNDRGKIVGLVGVIQNISERKRVEADRRKSKELFTVLIQNSLDIIIRLDKDGSIQYISPSVEQILGKPPDYFTGKNIIEFVHPADVSRIRESFILHTQNPARLSPLVEFRIQHSTGSWVDLEVRANNLLHDPDIQSIIINGREITGRKQAEKALQASERKNRALIEGIPDLMIRMDRDGTYLEVIPAKAYGAIASPQEMVGKNIADFLPEDVAKQRIEAVRKTLETGIPQIVEYTLHVQDKIQVPVHPPPAFASPRNQGEAFKLPPVNGGTEGGRGERVQIKYYEARIVVSGNNETLTLICDITGRKQSEATLRQSEARYRSLFENSPISLWEEDFSALKEYLDRLRQEGVDNFRAYFTRHPEKVLYAVSLVKIIDVNQATLELTGMENKETFFTDLGPLFEPDAIDVYREELVAIAEGKTRFASEFIARKLGKDEVFIDLQLLVAPGYEDTYDKVMVAIEDITESKLAEVALRESEERYRQLLEKTQETLVDTEALYLISQTLIDYENLPHLLQSVSDKVQGALLANTVLLTTVNLEAQQITEYVISGDPEKTATSLSFEELMAGLSGWAIREQEPVLSLQETPESRESEETLQRRNRSQIGSIIVAPLRRRDKVLGTITAINRKNEPDFTQKDVDFLMAIASQVAIAIENAQLYKQARQDAATKAVLLNEVNHRVKNNLAAIIGLLYAEQIHATRDKDVSIQDISENMISRIQGLATVHQLLSVSDWTPLSLNELTVQVIASALQILPPDKQVSVSVSPSSVRVTPAQANSLALIINELTTNTVKYAFTKHQDVRINVGITCNNNTVAFEYKDDGPGYPANVLNTGQHNLGIYLIKTIVTNGLRGEVALRNDQGSIATIHFPAEQ